MTAFNPRELLEGKTRPEGEEDELPRMGFFQHLEELRKRLIVSLLAVFGGFLLAWYWAPQVFDFLARPIRQVLPPGQNLAYTRLTEPFLMYFRVALLAGILATAEGLGVREALFDRWRSEDAGLPDQALKRIQMNAPKAWRFVGEMSEISHTFTLAGAPGEFHIGAADIYQRLAEFKDAQTPPTLEQILEALCATKKEASK